MSDGPANWKEPTGHGTRLFDRAPAWPEVAEVLCAERCAQAGDKPCSALPGNREHCDECEGQAKRILENFRLGPL